MHVDRRGRLHHAGAPTLTDAKVPPLHAVVAFGAAALLFAMQPWAAKVLLPQFGGSAAVWLTTMLFFQASVLLGYAYAHRIGGRAPWFVHVGFLAAAAAVGLSLNAWQPSAVPPLNVLASLAAGVGIPAVLLGATTPLLHAWIVGDEATREPYALYAASNAGSLAGLFAYPLLIEPSLPLAQQTTLLAAGLVALTVGFAAARFSRALGPGAAPVAATTDGQPGGPGTWFAYSFVPASLLYGFTAFLLRDIVAVPMLWVLPLAAYLLTYVVAFGRRPRRLPVAFVWFAPVLVFVVALTTVALDGGALALAVHALAFVLLALYFHGELSRARPADPREGTSFYLWVAAGGLAAGVFNAVVAPLWFAAPLEYALTYALALVLIPANYGARFPLAVRRGLHATMMLVLAVAFLLAPGEPGPKLGAASLMALAFVGALTFPALSHVMLALFLGAVVTYPGAAELVDQRRSFYGTHTVERRVLDGVEVRALRMGGTEHGVEAVAGEVAPLGYYHREGPVGEVFAALPGAPRRVAVVGLGVGGLAAYSRPGDTFQFIELDATVAAVAREHFRALSAARGDVVVTIADGRLGLGEAPDAAFDLIVIDAFASDAIPSHLLTVEAFELYARKLASNGVLLLHTSNRFIDIDRVAVGALQAGGWTHRQRRFTPAGQSALVWPSSWVVAVPAGASTAVLDALTPWQTLQRGVVWTDAHSSLLAAWR